MLHRLAGAVAAVLLPLLLSGSPAGAGPVADRIRAHKLVRCGAVERPGLLETRPDGTGAGLLADICRAAGVAAAGPDVNIRLDAYDGDRSFELARSGADDIVFLSGAEIVDHGLSGTLLPGTTAVFAQSGIMVAAASPSLMLADLSGQAVCFLQGASSQRHLEAWFAARHLPLLRMGFEEPVEMYDAFDAGMCSGLAGDVTTLAEIRRGGGPNRRNGRILGEPLATFPIVAATGTADAGWSAIVAWTIATLQDADRPKRDWAAGGLDSLPMTAAEFGLPIGWQKTVISVTGTYAEILRRNVGAASSLRLPPGPNALAEQGGLLTPPYAE